MPNAPSCRRLYRDPTLPVTLGAAPGRNVVSVQNYRDDTRDWRQLSPKEVASFFQDSVASAELPTSPRLYPTNLRRSVEHVGHLAGVTAAVAIGTMQACGEGSYWAPSALDPSAEVVRGIRTPLSRAMASTPNLSALEARPVEDGDVVLTLCDNMSPVDVCQLLAAEPSQPHVGLLRFVAESDTRAECPELGDHREAQLLLRTTYSEALQNMRRHLHGDPVRLLESGALIYTVDVNILRGPIEGGAIWLPDPGRVDVCTVALQRNPRCDDQGQYARTDEKARAVEAIDRALACAAAQGVEVLVLPPPGIGGAGGCRHPAADIGDIIHKAISTYGKHISRFYVCQDYPGQLHAAGCWETFASAVERGRDPVVHRGLVPLAASPYIRPGWTKRAAAR
jgi:hypothetical protein